MSHCQTQVITASFSHTHELLKAIKDKWSGVDLTGPEQWLLEEWLRSSVKVLKDYLERLSGGAWYKPEEEKEQRRFPAKEHNWLTTVLRSIFATYGPEKNSNHNKPSTLPFFAEIPPYELARHRVASHPLLDPLLIEIGLDLIGLALFRQHRRHNSPVGERRSKASSESRHDEYVREYIEYQKQSHWERLRTELSLPLVEGFQSLSHNEKVTVVSDLKETSDNVYGRSKIDSAELREWIVECLQKDNIDFSSPVEFQPATRRLLIASGGFAENSHTTHASSSTHATQLSLRKRSVYPDRH